MNSQLHACSINLRKLNSEAQFEAAVKSKMSIRWGVIRLSEESVIEVTDILLKSGNKIICSASDGQGYIVIVKYKTTEQRLIQNVVFTSRLFIQVGIDFEAILYVSGDAIEGRLKLTKRDNDQVFAFYNGSDRFWIFSDLINGTQANGSLCFKAGKSEVSCL